MPEARAPGGHAIRITEMGRDDWEPVRSIYEEGIATGDATFESSAPSWERWDAGHLSSPRLVALLGASVAGWAALSPYSTRAVYRGVAEVSVYVAADARGQGIGRSLLEELVPRSEAAGIWTLQAGVFPENAASLRLLDGVGFRVVGIRERLGRAPDRRWRDVVLLERRSRSVGT